MKTFLFDLDSIAIGLRLGHKPSDYSSLLLMLRQKQTGLESAFVISGMAQSQIASRIKSILQFNSSRRPMAQALAASGMRSGGTTSSPTAT